MGLEMNRYLARCPHCQSGLPPRYSLQYFPHRGDSSFHRWVVFETTPGREPQILHNVRSFFLAVALRRLEERATYRQLKLARELSHV